MKRNNEKGFVLVFVIAVVAALSVMTSAMHFYYDTDLKSVSRNSVQQQVMLAAETGLQEGQFWVESRLNANSFDLVDIQNKLHTDNSDNKCLNRHGFSDNTKDVWYAKRLSSQLTAAAGTGNDDRKFENMSYEVYVQRHADVVRSIYFSGNGPVGIPTAGTDYTNRSFALVDEFKDFPNDKFTIEMWIKNEQPTDTYNVHAFEWGREWDLVFKILNNNWSPRLGEVALGGAGGVGTPKKDEWVHIAWVWDGGDDPNNVRIYQDGTLAGTYNADIGSRTKSGYSNPPDKLPEVNLPLAIGEGLHGFAPQNYSTGSPKIQGTPWLGNIAEMRIWSIPRTQTDIANNNRKRLSGSEPGLVSYYKFSEGGGTKAADFNTSRPASRNNEATIYGIGTVGTKWETELVKYPVTAVAGSTGPTINVPPGEDIVYYKILSCGIGPDGQIVPLELIVSAPVQKGDVGDGKVALTREDVNSLTGEMGTPRDTSLYDYIGDPAVADDIKIQTSDNVNTNFFAYKRSMEQCNNANSFANFSTTVTYSEGDCVISSGKTWIVENDSGVTSGNQFNEDDWQEVMGGDCDGVRFLNAGDNDQSHGHFYKYFSTAPDIDTDVGYNRDNIDWWEAKRRAESSTCGGLRGYLVSVDTADENDFIRQAIMCDNTTDTNCGAQPFHVRAGVSREQYYGSRMSQTNDQHYVWLGNSDWRTPGTMRSESGPNMGNANVYNAWQNGEPNNGGEDYADMEINRTLGDRDDGGWNDLNRMPNCRTDAVDCLTGYIVEYGGFDSFRLNNDVANSKEDVLTTTKFCVARATIEADKYVSTQDRLKYDTTAEDAQSDIAGSTLAVDDNDTSDVYVGFNSTTGVLTLFHNEKPANWSTTSSYSTGDFVWYNNRVWKALANISSASLTKGQTPTILNPSIWELYSGNESDAPCDDLDDWQNAFESIKYFNLNEVEVADGVNPFINENLDADSIASDSSSDSSDDDSSQVSLGERTILFSLGPLHVNKHIDGYNHFYEFFKFPVNATSPYNLYNDKNRRFGDGFQLANRLRYFGKTGYLATITSETENEVITTKAKGNGWLGGHIATPEMNSTVHLNRCGGLRQRATRAQASADWRALRNLNTIAIYTTNASYNDGDRVLNPLPVISNDYTPANITINAISKADPAQVDTTGNHSLEDDDVVLITDDTMGRGVYTTADVLWGLRTGIYRVRRVDNNSFTLHHYVTRDGIDTSGFSGNFPTGAGARMREVDTRNEYYEVTANISNANANASNQPGLRLFFKDPALAWLNTSNPAAKTVSSITTANPAEITTGSAHGYETGDVIRVQDASTKNLGAYTSAEVLWGLGGGFYRITKTSNTQFTLQDMYTGANISSSSFSGTPAGVEVRQMLYTEAALENDECPVYRWITGPEQFLHTNRGLALSSTRVKDANPSANEKTVTLPRDGQPGRGAPTWTRSGNIGPSGQQVGEVFKDGMPFRYFSGYDEPNNAGMSEPAIHMLGSHFSNAGWWNDLHNWNANHSHNYGIRGLVIEYGGMENDGDPITRIAAKRVINLFDRRVTKAIIKIKTGAQSGDKLMADTDQLTNIGMTVSGNETSTITLTGDATCQNYLDAVRGIVFRHNASSAGTREIEVKIGDVAKPTGANHYYRLVNSSQSYAQADFQSSYQNLCGLQGYLAVVRTTADRDALSEIGATAGNQYWVNGTDECQGGLFRSGFWRYTSGPFKDKEFWRTRINSSAAIDTDVGCGVTATRTPANARVGPFADYTSGSVHPIWATNHPAANTNDYLAYNHTTSTGTRRVLTRSGEANSAVPGYVVRFGDSVGDFTGADIEEDNNNIEVILGPIKAKITFYSDGTDNSLYIQDEDTIVVPTLSSGWTGTSFDTNGNSYEATITAPTNTIVTLDDWRNEIAKAYYQSESINNFTSGNRKIKIELVYTDTSRNTDVAVLKTIGSRNRVVVTPVSWNNR